MGGKNLQKNCQVLCTYVHAEGQQYRLPGVAPCPPLLLLFLPFLLLLPGLALLCPLLHLLPAVINDGSEAVSVCQQEGVSLSCAHVPDPDPL